MNFPIQALRAKIAAAALGTVVLTAGHAALAKNHDCQAFKLRDAVLSLHDRAPGPGLHVPN